MRIDTKSILRSIYVENTNKLVFANLNSVRNKFELPVDQIKGRFGDF